MKKTITIILLLIIVGCVVWLNIPGHSLISESLTLNLSKMIIGDSADKSNEKFGPLGEKSIDLHEFAANTIENVQDYDKIDKNYVPGKDWKTSVLLQPSSPSYVMWSIKGKFSTLTLSIQPYSYKNKFSDDAVAELQIINHDSGAVISKTTISKDTGSQDVMADITRVDHLQIKLEKKKGSSADCIMSDFVIHPAGK